MDDTNDTEDVDTHGHADETDTDGHADEADTDAVDGSYTAVLDRIEAGAEADDELAVLVLERDGRTVDDLVVALDALPADGRTADTVFDVVVEDGELVSATVDAERTASRGDRAGRRFRRLARRLPRRDEAESRTSEDGDEPADRDGRPGR